MQGPAPKPRLRNGESHPQNTRDDCLPSTWAAQDGYIPGFRGSGNQYRAG